MQGGRGAADSYGKDRLDRNTKGGTLRFRLLLCSYASRGRSQEKNQKMVFFHLPDAAGADARAQAAADTVFIVGDVLKRTVRIFLAGDGSFGTGFQAHGAVAAGCRS